jgi:hypothetical protein
MVCIPSFPSVLLLVVLSVVDLDQEHVYLHVLSVHPCRSTASGSVKVNILNLFLCRSKSLTWRE